MDCLTIFKGTFIRAETLNGFYKYNSFFNDLLFSYYFILSHKTYILCSNCDLNNNWFAKGNHPPWLVEYIFGIIGSETDRLHKFETESKYCGSNSCMTHTISVATFKYNIFPNRCRAQINQFVSIYIYLGSMRRHYIDIY